MSRLLLRHPFRAHASLYLLSRAQYTCVQPLAQAHSSRRAPHARALFLSSSRFLISEPGDAGGASAIIVAKARPAKKKKTK